MFRVEYAKGVVKDLKKLPKETAKKALGIVETILAKDPSQGIPLKGSYKGLWKYRVGDYRIVYSVESHHLVILVLRIRHRKDVYKGIVF